MHSSLPNNIVSKLEIEKNFIVIICHQLYLFNRKQLLKLKGSYKKNKSKKLWFKKCLWRKEMIISYFLKLEKVCIIVYRIAETDINRTQL